MRSTRHPFLLDTVWLDKWRFDEAERLFHEAGQRRPEAGVGPPAPDGTGKRRPEKCAPRYRPVAVREEAAAAGDPGTPARELRPAVACHHLVAGVWINRGTFDEAELLFLTRSQARAVPRSLPIPSSRRSPKPRPTPDEGYASVGATPVTPAAPSPRENGTSPIAPIHRPPTREVRLEEPRPIPDEGYASVGATPVTPATPGPRGNGTSPTAPIDRPPAREVWLKKTRPTPDEGYASVGSTPVTPATPNLQGNGTSPIDCPPAREVWLEKTRPTPDEGYASVGSTPVTPATPNLQGNGTSPIDRPPAREVWLEKTRPTPDEGYASVGSTPVTPATPNLQGNGTSPIDRPPAREVWLEKTRPILDEGYASVSATPVTPDTPTPPASGTSPTAPIHRLPAREVWLEKPLYDEAERLYHEGRAEPRDGPHRSGAAPTPRTAHPGPAPKPGPPPASAHRHLVHRDNEPVWFNRAAHDAAELRLHLPDGRGMTGKTQELPAASPPAPPTERTIPAPRSPGTQDKTMAVNVLANENIWFDKCKYDDAEMKYYSQTHDSVPANTPVQNTARNPPAAQENGASNILRDIARARENIQKSLAGSAMQGGDGELCSRVTALEKENLGLHKEVEKLRLTLSKLELRLSTVEKSLGGSKPAVCPPAPTHAQPAAQQPVEDGDDEIDLFGSSDEEESRESERVREERLRQYAAKKSNKPGLVAKSSILLDVKPWDDETDMGKLEECVRTVQMDGLVWGASKLVPVGYGIKKLQIQCVVEDDKVGTDQLEEGITKFEDYVQSVDVAAFNKV